MILLTCRLSQIYSLTTAARQAKITRKRCINYDYRMNDSRNKEMCFTFRCSAAASDSWWNQRDSSLQVLMFAKFRIFFPLFNTSQTTTPEEIFLKDGPWGWCVLWNNACTKTRNQHFDQPDNSQLDMVMCFRAKGFSVVLLILCFKHLIIPPAA